MQIARLFVARPTPIGNAYRAIPLISTCREMRNKATPSAGKAKADREREVTATRFIRRLKVAVRDGHESRVSALVKEAHKSGVSSKVTERALDRIQNRGQLDDVLYEGTLPGGVCLLIEALTDKKSRTAPEVRHALSKNGGTLGASGSALWAFEKKGMLELEPASEGERDELLELVMGWEDVEDVEDTEPTFGEDSSAGVAGGGSAGDAPPATAGVRVVVEPSAITATRAALADAGATVVSEVLAYVPHSVVAIEEEEARAAYEAALDALRALDDVEAVWTNAQN